MAGSVRSCCHKLLCPEMWKKPLQNFERCNKYCDRKNACGTSGVASTSSAPPPKNFKSEFVSAEKSLKETEYGRMPPVFHLDRYETCLHGNDSSGIYCSVKFDLVSDEPIQLYDLIRNYSAKTDNHFNHTKLFYGLCLTKTCKQFYTENTTEDLGVTLERCLNISLWEEYELKARVQEYTCEDANKETKMDSADIAIGILLGVLLLLNILGCLQDFSNENIKGGTTLLGCFSLRRNWKNFVAPADGSSNPRLERLKGFYGVRTINMLVVIACHSFMPFYVNVDNTRYAEEAYTEFGYQILLGVSLILQTFFVMSGFLLSYNMQLDAEKHTVSWKYIWKAVRSRYLRLTLPSLVVLAVTSTWMRHLGSGPLWQTVVMSEVNDCRQYWWRNLLYLNNLDDDSICMIHTWYLAADFQLYVIGVLLCALTAGMCRKVLLGLIFVAGVVLPAAITYNHDLDGNLVFSHETIRNMFITDNTFNYTYKPGYTNLAGFVIGVALGLIVYHWQTTDFKFSHSFLKHRVIFCLSVPIMVALIFVMGNNVHGDNPRPSLLMRTFCAALVKPAFSGAFALLVIGMVFKLEDLYRGFLEWSGWTLPSRLSYSAYLLHMFFIKLAIGVSTTLVHLSALQILQVLTSTIVISLIAAIPFHLLVEAPSVQLVKLLTSERKGHEERNAGHLLHTNGKLVYDRKEKKN